MEKSKFLSFLFSLFPGSGQMYLGFMRRGTSIMLLFWGTIAAIALLHLDFLVYLLPVQWFYAFFDALSTRQMPYIERINLGDHSIFENFSIAQTSFLFQKRHILIGTSCIILGLYSMFYILVRPFIQELSEAFPWVYSLFHSLPSVILAIAIILFGIYLIRGKRPQGPIDIDEQDYVEYRRNEHESK